MNGFHGVLNRGTRSYLYWYILCSFREHNRWMGYLELSYNPCQWLLVGWCPRGLLVHQRYPPSYSHNNVRVVNTNKLCEVRHRPSDDNDTSYICLIFLIFFYPTIYLHPACIEVRCHMYFDRGCRGRDRMVVRFTPTCAISAYHH